MKAWWHSGIYKNKSASGEPLILIYFNEEQTLKYSSRSIPITQLNKYFIGSVWHDEECVGSHSYEERVFDVSFDKDSYFFTRSSNPRLANSPPYPNEIHPFWNGKNDSWLIEFPLKSGGMLVVPCLEILSRLYGRSSEIKRIITSNPWQQSIARLTPDVSAPEVQGEYSVIKPYWAVNGDIPFLACLKYEEFTQQSVANVYSQIEASYTPNSKQPIFIKVRPWFEGLAKLKVAGISFNHGNSFLGLQILGCSEPQGRKVSVLVNEATDRRNASITVDKSQTVTEQTSVNVTSTQSPDRSAREHIDQEPAFETLGNPCSITRRKIKRADSSYVPTTVHAKLFETLDSLTVSADDQKGSRKGIRKNIVQAPEINHSNRALNTVWTTLKSLESHNQSIYSVASAHTDGQRILWSSGYKLLSFRKHHVADTNWPYNDVSATTFRQFLLCCINANGKEFFLLELERRVRQSCAKGEENYQGLVFCIEDSIESTLRILIPAIVREKGIMKKVIRQVKIRATTFSHRECQDDRYTYETAILNALRKLH